jgi:alkylation response protein AidB-like acyl-CoA dehydrogenase
VSGGVAMSTPDLDVSDADRLELRNSVRRFLDQYSPESAVRRVMMSEEGYDPTLWARLADQLGLTALIVPDSFEGMGYGWRELGSVMREMGASVYPGPFLSTVFATTALLELASESACASLLPEISAGRTLVSFAAAGNGRPGATREPLRRVTRDHGGVLTVSGTLDFVLDAHVADRLIVLTRVGDTDALLSVDVSGVRVTPLLGMDLTRRLSRVELSDARAVDITSPSLTPAAVARCYALMAVALAAEQLGGAERAFATTIEYLMTRVQFGRVIGSFQAIKHRCADLAVLIESARATCEAALDSAEANSTDLVLVSHVAAASCSDAYLAVARAMIQLHGGVGFTWEHSAHLHLKRAKTDQMILGLPAWHRRMVGRLIGLVPVDANQ